MTKVELVKGLPEATIWRALLGHHKVVWEPGDMTHYEVWAMPFPLDIPPYFVGSTNIDYLLTTIFPVKNKCVSYPIQAGKFTHPGYIWEKFLGQDYDYPPAALIFSYLITTAVGGEIPKIGPGWDVTMEDILGMERK